MIKLLSVQVHWHTFSLVSTASTNDVPPYEAKILWIAHDCTRPCTYFFPKQNVYGWTVFRQWLLRTRFLSFYCFYCGCCCCCCCCWSAVFGFFFYYFFIMLVLILCGYVRYYFFEVLGIHIIYLCNIERPFHVIFNVCLFTITFFIAFSWALFFYLLIISRLNFP